VTRDDGEVVSIDDAVEIQVAPAEFGLDETGEGAFAGTRDDAGHDDAVGGVHEAVRIEVAEIKGDRLLFQPIDKVACPLFLLRGQALHWNRRNSKDSSEAGTIMELPRVRGVSRRAH